MTSTFQAITGAPDACGETTRLCDPPHVRWLGATPSGVKPKTGTYILVTDAHTHWNRYTFAERLLLGEES